jgi:hypothetical protein
MKRNRNGSRPQRTEIRVWTLEQARRAQPYITSVLTSLREHWLELKDRDRKAKHLANQPGRPDRTRLLAHAEAMRAAQAARDRWQDAEEELHALDVYCINPIRGEAVIPFAHDNQLAWYLFDLFEADPLRFWRYHTDPLDMRRPIEEQLAA